MRDIYSIFACNLARAVRNIEKCLGKLKCARADIAMSRLWSRLYTYYCSLNGHNFHGTNLIYTSCTRNRNAINFHVTHGIISQFLYTVALCSFLVKNARPLNVALCLKMTEFYDFIFYSIRTPYIFMSHKLKHI